MEGGGMYVDGRHRVHADLGWLRESEEVGECWVSRFYVCVCFSSR